MLHAIVLMRGGLQRDIVRSTQIFLLANFLL